MSRVGLIMLMTAGLLYCPYRCAAKSAAASMPGQAMSTCVCCAKKCQINFAGIEAPMGMPAEQPADDDGASSCLCGGAIVVVQKVVASESVGGTEYFGLLASGNHSAGTSIEHFARGAKPPNRIDAGKGLRVAMRSLLL